jgi:hypothetical protein
LTKHRRRDQQRHREDEQTQADHDIKGTFQELIDWAAPEAVRIKQPARFESFEVDRPGLAFPKIEKVRHLNAGELAM